MPYKSIILGITGTSAAGKDTAALYLEKKGFIHHSCSDILREELKKRSLEESIDNLANLGNELRAKFGPGILGERILKKIIENKEKRAVVTSIRHPDEAKALKKSKKFFLIAIDAPIKIRYQRIQSRQRAGDQISFEEFKNEEKAQMQGKGPQIQLLKCMEMADFKIINKKSLDEFYQKIDDILKKVEKRQSF